MTRSTSAAIPKIAYKEVMRGVERLKEEHLAERSRNPDNPPSDPSKKITQLVEKALRRSNVISDIEERSNLFLQYLAERSHITPLCSGWQFCEGSWTNEEYEEWAAAQEGKTEE